MLAPEKRKQKRNQKKDFVNGAKMEPFETTHHIVCCCRITKKEHIDLHDEVAFWIRKTISQKYKVFPEGANKQERLSKGAAR